MFTKDHQPIASEGYLFIGISLLLILIGFFVHKIVFVVFIFLCGFMIFFFRNPQRHPPADDNLVIAPADGRVVLLSEVKEERFLKKDTRCVSIFMSPLDVHVNRMPIAGVVKKVTYNKGKFITAFTHKASLDNEQNAILMQSEKGEEILFVQIAGWLARRIVCHAEEGQNWRQGAIFGMICFGSRIDVYLSNSYEVEVKVGDKVRAGESVLAKWNDKG